MCLALIAINQHPLYPIILITNRDEFYDRRMLPAHFWKDNPSIYAGIDLQQGGTWLGLNKQGAFALVTNYRNPGLYQENLASRGFLVKNYLESEDISATEYLQKIALMADTFNPFNLLLGTIGDVRYYSNVSNTEIILKPGVYGLSNSLLDVPWFKVVRAKELFNKVLSQLQTLEDPQQINELVTPILQDRVLAPDDQLPDTGVSKELEKALSSIFVAIPEYKYGTTNSSVVLIGEREQFMIECAINSG